MTTSTLINCRVWTRRNGDVVCIAPPGQTKVELRACFFKDAGIDDLCVRIFQAEIHAWGSNHGTDLHGKAFTDISTEELAKARATAARFGERK